MTCSFDWFDENRSNIEAISDNEECGCCIDTYFVILREGPTPPIVLNEESGTFDESKLLYGKSKDELIDDLV